MREDLRDRLKALDEALAPVALAEHVRAVALGGDGADFDIDDLSSANVDKAVRRKKEKVIELGRAVGEDRGTLAVLLPELMCGPGDLWNFGTGLAEGTNDPKEVWKELCDAYAAASARYRQVFVHRGFLDGLHGKNPELVNELLDESLADKCLGEKFPSLHTAIAIDSRGVERLKRCLKLGNTPVGEFSALALGGATAPISGEDLRDLISLLLSQPDGESVALEVLYMRFFFDATQKKALAGELVQAGCDLLKMITYKKKGQKQDHQLAGVARACLPGEAGKDAFQVVIRNFMAAVAKHEAYVFQYEDFLHALFEARPFDALDAFVGENGETGTILTEMVARNKNPLEAASDEVIIQWCEREPAKRCPAIARVLARFESEKDASPPSWNPLALKLIERAPDAVSVLKELVQGLRPSSWTGSRASSLATRLPLLEGLKRHPNASVAEFARQEIRKLKQEIEEERRRELKRGRDLDERFE